MVHSKALFVKLVWLPSHLTNNPSNKPIPAYVKPWHVAANEVVDELAKLAAKEVQLEKRCFVDYFKYLK